MSLITSGDGHKSKDLIPIGIKSRARKQSIFWKCLSTLYSWGLWTIINFCDTIPPPGAEGLARNDYIMGTKHSNAVLIDDDDYHSHIYTGATSSTMGDGGYSPGKWKTISPGEWWATDGSGIVVSVGSPIDRRDIIVETSQGLLGVVQVGTVLPPSTHSQPSAAVYETQNAQVLPEGVVPFRPDEGQPLMPDMTLLQEALNRGVLNEAGNLAAASWEDYNYIIANGAFINEPLAGEEGNPDMGWISDIYETVDAGVFGGNLPGGAQPGGGVYYNNTPATTTVLTGDAGTVTTGGVPGGAVAACGTDRLVYKQVGGVWKWVKRRKRRRRALATKGDLKDLAALKGILGNGKAFETWIATHA